MGVHVVHAHFHVPLSFQGRNFNLDTVSISMYNNKNGGNAAYEFCKVLQSIKRQGKHRHMENFFEALVTGATWVGTLIGLLYAYRSIYVVIGFFRTKTYPKTDRYHRYAIVIAARNEQSSVISLGMQRNPYPCVAYTAPSLHSAPEHFTTQSLTWYMRCLVF